MHSRIILTVFCFCWVPSSGQAFCEPQVATSSPPNCPLNPGYVLSTICPDISSYAGPWYVVYWGAPGSINVYTNGTQCVQLFGTVISNDTLTLDGIQIFENGRESNITNVTIKMEKYSDDCCYYTIIQDDVETKAELVEFHRNKYAFGSVQVNDKRYLLIYLRDPRVLLDCNYLCLYEKWITKTENNASPGFVSDANNCLCIN